MSFQPIVPMPGYTGWRFLDRTLAAQQAAFAKSQPVARATEYFRSRIASISSADDLVNDRRLLAVALGAFGLDEDINNRFFIRKILADGTATDEALANRLADRRYAALSRSFGLDDPVLPGIARPGFADQLIARYETKQFEQAIGSQNNDLRLALNLRGGLDDIVAQHSSDAAQWFAVMGNTPLRKVFETALGLPARIASIDIDQQRDIFRARARAIFGTDQIAAFTDQAQQEKLIRLFLVRAEAAQGSFVSGAAAAVTLLQSAPRFTSWHR